MSKRPLVVYVDVDDTIMRSSGTKRFAITRTVEHVRSLAKAGAHLYCWSSVGAEYAREAATAFGMERHFVAFLPKPNVMIDDQPPDKWRGFMVVDPLNADDSQIQAYAAVTGTSLEPNT